MKAFVLHAFGLDNLKFEVIPDPPSPAKNQVLIRYKAASINYRDTLVIAGKYDPRFPLPFVPLSDGAGVIEEVGSDVVQWKKGDLVLTPFAPNWLDGKPERSEFRNSLGGPLDGTLREFALFNAESIVSAPKNLSIEESASLPCAALTAWSALVEENPIESGQTVLVQGTGGVSMFALQIAKAKNANVILTTSSPSKAIKAKELGADWIIDSNEFPEWSKEVRKITNKRGVDHIIEVGGSNTLPQSIKSCASFGTISLIGVLGGNSTDTNLLPIVMNQINLQGIVVGSVGSLDRMCRFFEKSNIKPVLDPIQDWKDSLKIIKEFPQGKHLGKVVLNIS
jgi:NADPH:quinone reductase-like Zn-dependent oxidoreductase